MKLSILERITLLNVLPKEGNILTVRIIKNLRERVDFKEEELKTFELKISNNTIQWNRLADVGTEIDITEVEGTVVKKELKLLDEQNKLTLDHVSLYEKFME